MWGVELLEETTNLEAFWKLKKVKTHTQCLRKEEEIDIGTGQSTLRLLLESSTEPCFPCL